MDSKINYLFNILNAIIPNQVFYAHYVTEDVKLPYIVYQELNKKSADYADDVYLYKVSTIQISLISLKKDLELEKKLEYGLDLRGITYQMISEYLGPDKTMHRIYEIKWRNLNMSNKVTFGLKNVHYAVATPNEDDTWDYSEPKKLIGAQELTAEVISGKTDVYADDRILATLVSNSGSTITLKLTELDDDFKVAALGYAKDSNGNLVELVSHKIKTFALGYEIQGDVKSRRVWYYLCTASPVGDATKTKAESIEANSVSLTITARSVEAGNVSVIRTIAKFGDPNYNTFFNEAPTLPTIGV